MGDLRKTYKEINIILNILGESYKNKLPKKMLAFFEKKEDKKHDVNIELEDLYSNKILPETKILVCMLYINYWTENDEEKENYKEMLRKTNEDESINTDIYNIFDGPKAGGSEDMYVAEDVKPELKEEITALMIRKEKKFSFAKLKEKVLNIFRKFKK